MIFYRYKIKNYIAGCILILLAISGTSVANIVSDMFQSYESLKFSDIFFIYFIISFLFFSHNFVIFSAHLIDDNLFFFILFLLFLSFATISVLFNLRIDVFRSIAHLLRLYYYLCMMFFVAYISVRYLTVEEICYGLYLGIVCTCLISVYILFSKKIGSFIADSNIRKLGSELGANPIATYAAALFPVGVCKIFSKDAARVRAINVLFVIAIIMTTLLAESKSAWIVILVDIVLYILLQPNYISKIKILLYFLCGFLLNANWIIRIVEGEIKSSVNPNVMDRITMYFEALQYSLDNPFFGIGYSNYINISSRGYDPHSGYALIFSEIGMLGGVCYCFINAYVIIDLFRRRYKGSNKLLLMLFVNILILELFTCLFATQLVKYICFGLYLANKKLQYCPLLKQRNV